MTNIDTNASVAVDQDGQRTAKLYRAAWLCAGTSMPEDRA